MIHFVPKVYCKDYKDSAQEVDDSTKQGVYIQV